MNFICKQKWLTNLLNTKDENEFVKSINSIDYWGGSGAIWEIYE